MDTLPEATHLFEAQRPRLLRLAYRMLGSVAEAQDVVQDAWLRWQRADVYEVRNVPAFLNRIVTRLCLDAMKSARVQRETYIGSWLPDPLPDLDDDLRADNLTLTLMLALERLSPLERAAFLLHDVFGVSFDEIAKTLDRDTTACRQLAARARDHVREARPRFKVEKQHGLELAEAFFAASRSGDMGALSAMLAADVSLHADGGGKRTAAMQPIRGFDHVLKAHKAFSVLFRKHGSHLVRTVFINGLPGFVTRESDGELQTTALEIEDGKITGIYVMRNPDKLRHVH